MDETEELYEEYKTWLLERYNELSQILVDSLNLGNNSENAAQQYIERHNELFLEDDAQESSKDWLILALLLGYKQGNEDIDANVAPDYREIDELNELNIKSFEDYRDAQLERYQEVIADDEIEDKADYFEEQESQRNENKADAVAENSSFNAERAGVAAVALALAASVNCVRETRRDNRVRPLHARYQSKVTTISVFKQINRIDGFGCRCRMRLTTEQAEVTRVENMRIKNYYELSSKKIIEKDGRKALKLIMRSVVGDSAMNENFYPSDSLKNVTLDNAKLDIDHDNNEVGKIDNFYIEDDVLMGEAFLFIDDLLKHEKGVDLFERIQSDKPVGVSFEGEILRSPLSDVKYDWYDNPYKFIVEKFSVDYVSLLVDETAAGASQWTAVANKKGDDMDKDKEIAQLKSELESERVKNSKLAQKVSDFEAKQAALLKEKVKNAAEKTGFDADFFEGFTADKVDTFVAKHEAQQAEIVKNSKSKLIEDNISLEGFEKIELPASLRGE